jgi:hypothetical protein
MSEQLKNKKETRNKLKLKRERLVALHHYVVGGYPTAPVGYQPQPAGRLIPPYPRNLPG